MDLLVSFDETLFFLPIYSLVNPGVIIFLLIIKLLFYHLSWNDWVIYPLLISLKFRPDNIRFAIDQPLPTTPTIWWPELRICFVNRWSEAERDVLYGSRRIRRAPTTDQSKTASFSSDFQAPIEPYRLEAWALRRRQGFQYSKSTNRKQP